jgi:hypothetical protein
MCADHDDVLCKLEPLQLLAQRYERDSEFAPTHKDISTTDIHEIMVLLTFTVE